MTHPVTSKFSYFFWVKAFVFTLYMGVTAVACMSIWVKNPELWPAGLFSAISLAVYIFLMNKSFRRFTASPDGLIIHYIWSRKRIVVNYADITHVANMAVHYSPGTLNEHTAANLEIDLSDGKEIAFFKSDYDNYDELKEAIRRYRFHLP